MDDDIRQAAYDKWEAEGRPEGQHDRHWLEAEREVKSKDLPKTWSADRGGGVAPSTTEDPQHPRDEGTRPQDLTSENDQGAS